MTTHFGDHHAPRSKQTLKIVTSRQNRLSPDQLRFNKLTDRIRKLEKEIEKESKKLEKLFGVFMHDVQPIALKNAGIMMTVAALLDGFAEKTKLKKRQLESVQDMIIDLCENSFEIVDPTAEQKAIYDHWSDVSFDAEYQQQMDDSKAALEQMVKEQMGIDIDMTDIDDSPEGFARFQKKIEEEMGKAEARRSSSKKSKKQLQAEVRMKMEEDVKNKSIRSIYIALAKVLHPDTEIDPVRKKEKEEVMKQVTQAYADKDLTALLRLELEWVQKESLHVDLLTDEKLKIYLSALEDQVADLKQEKSMLSMHPRYLPVARFAQMPEERALEELRWEARNLKQSIADFTRFKNTLESGLSPKEILNQVREYLDADLYSEMFIEELEALLPKRRR
jgi:hypothetical protein